MKKIFSKDSMVSALKSWLPLGFVATMVFLGIAGTAQQMIRQSANDPQIQMAEDLAASLSSGTSTKDTFNSSKINIAESLATFTGIFDQDGKLLSSDYELNGKEAVPPKGVLDYAKSHGENRLTWQPESGVRIALVVKSFNNENKSGYVLVGRSMRETENCTSDIENMIFWGWLTTVLLSFAITILVGRQRK